MAIKEAKDNAKNVKFLSPKNLMRKRMINMLIGYARVSTIEQNTARQEVLLKEYGVDKLYIDKCSGKNMERPQLQEMLQFARGGDTIVVGSMDRLGRNARDLINIVDELQKRGIGFKCIKEGIGSGSPLGEAIMLILSALAQLERSYILERQREGIEIAKQKGVYKGRKPVEVDKELFEKIYDLWARDEITAKKAMDVLKLKTSTFYRRIREHKQVMMKKDNS
jgi:DNA invertase Pin-like site-specific DNA recombinase